MKKRVYLVLFSLIMILTITVPAYAHGGGHVIVNGGFWVGPGWGWGWGWGPGWWGYPGYPYPSYYSYPPYVIQQQPSVYETQTPRRDEEYYWYFCPDSKNYYPYVKKCPNGWLKVVPPQGPSQ